MIAHQVTVRHVVTYEALLNVNESDARKALATAEAAIFQNPELGKVIKRKVTVEDITATVTPDPATPATK